MKFDVFKVPFHPFNLVNNLKCFQYSFATIMYLVQSVMTFSKATFLCNEQLTSLILKTKTICMYCGGDGGLFSSLLYVDCVLKRMEISVMNAAIWNKNEICKASWMAFEGEKVNI